MRTARLAAAVLALFPLACPGAGNRLSVTVVDRDTGASVTNLQAGDFILTSRDGPAIVLSAVYETPPLDVLLVMDASVIGQSLLPAAGTLVGQMRPEDRMALITYQSAAVLARDFTGDRNSLEQALHGIRFAGSPRMLDALFAAIDTGFGATGRRRVTLLLSSGVAAPAQVTAADVSRLALERRAPIFAVAVRALGRQLIEALAHSSGGLVLPSLDAAWDGLRGRYIITTDRADCSCRVRDGKRRLAVAVQPLD